MRIYRSVRRHIVVFSEQAQTYAFEIWPPMTLHLASHSNIKNKRPRLPLCLKLVLQPPFFLFPLWPMASVPWFSVDKRRAWSGRVRWAYGPADKEWSFTAWSPQMAHFSLHAAGHFEPYKCEGHEIWHNKVQEKDFCWVDELSPSTSWLSQAVEHPTPAPDPPPRFMSMPHFPVLGEMVRMG